MLRSFCLVASVVMAAAGPLTGQEADSAVTAEMRAYTAAFGRNDIRALERFLAPEYRFTSSRGLILTRAEELAELRAGTFRADAAVLDELRVQRYGDAAVVTVSARLAGSWRGKRYDGHYRITAVWVRRQDRWLLVAEHASRIVQ